MARKKIKSKRNHSVVLTGLFDSEEKTIMECFDEGDIVYSLEEILRPFDGKEVSIIVRETNQLESV
jgi:hypothetical protein